MDHGGSSSDRSPRSPRSPRNPLVSSSSILDDNTEMTSSYHEISERERDSTTTTTTTGGGENLELSLPGAKRLLDRARNWVGDLSLDGVVSQEGQQLTYVTQDLGHKIQDASPQKHQSSLGRHESESSDQASLDIQTTDLNQVVNEMEIEAKKLASSVDTLTENLTGILHSLSSMTVDCVFTASDGVTQLCDTADASIKVMYQVMAKCEELNKAVQPLYQVQQQIKETKRLLDKVEAEMN